MSDLLPSLNHVYEKWEKKKPFTGGSVSASNVTTRNFPDREAWVSKYRDNLQVPDRRRRRREKAVPLPSFADSNSLGEFKVVPTILPENKHRRPFMGLTCSQCAPDSRNHLYEDSFPLLGIRDLLRVPTETRNNNIIVRSLCHVIYTFRRNVNHRYPDVSIAVMTNQNVAEAIRRAALDELADEESNTKKFVKVMKAANIKARKILKKMKAGISVTLVRFTGWFLVKALGYLLTSVQVHEGQMLMVKKASENDLPMIYLPMHKSHLDYILLTYILYHYDIKAPHVAAGDNLDIPLFSWLMRGLGGFFIRRRLDMTSGKKDVIYRAILQSYMLELLKNGQSMEFFIEGGRSRNGKAIRPKGGLLSVVVDSVTSGLVSDVYIVPVSISYEKLLDGDFKLEQLGYPKSRETFWKAVKGLWKVFRARFGSVRVDFSQPFSLQEYLLTSEGLNSRLPMSPFASSECFSSANRPVMPIRGSTTSLYGTDVVSEEQRDLVNRLAEHSIHSAVCCQAVMSTHLLAFLLLNRFRQGITIKSLIPVCDWLKEEINIRGRDVGFVGKTEDVVKYSCQLLGEDLVTLNRRVVQPNGVTDTVEEVELKPTSDLSGILQLFYYSNNLISVFILESVIASSICAVCNLELSAVNLLQGSTKEVSKVKVLDKSTWLCELMYYDFTFLPPCANLEDRLDEALDRFVVSEVLCVNDDGMTSMIKEKQWAHRISKTISWEDDDSEDDYEPDVTYQLNTDWDVAMEKLQFLRNIISPFVESYWLVCCQLIKLVATDMPESDFLNDIQKLAIERVKTDVATYAESAAHESIKNGVRALQRMNVISLYIVADVKMLSLTDAYQSKDKVLELVSLVETYKP